MSNSWPQEHLDILRKMAGSTSGEMLAAIRKVRPDATREAVCGQCSRHGIRLSSLSGKPTNRVKAGTRERIVNMRPSTASDTHNKAAWNPLPGTKPIPLMARTEAQCPWPIGEADPPALLQCCGGQKPLDVEYCEAHMMIRRATWQPPALNVARLAS